MVSFYYLPAWRSCSRAVPSTSARLNWCRRKLGLFFTGSLLPLSAFRLSCTWPGCCVPSQEKRQDYNAQPDYTVKKPLRFCHGISVYAAVISRTYCRKPDSDFSFICIIQNQAASQLRVYNIPDRKTIRDIMIWKASLSYKHDFQKNLAIRYLIWYFIYIRNPWHR